MHDTGEPYLGFANFHEILTVTLLEYRSWLGIQKYRDRRGRARREMSQTHAVTTSTFGDFFLQNHASSSGLLVG